MAGAEEGALAEASRAEHRGLDAVARRRRLAAAAGVYSDGRPGGEARGPKGLAVIRLLARGIFGILSTMAS